MREAAGSALLLGAVLLTPACSRTGNEPGEGGVTVAEQEQLDAIAAELDARADQVAPDTKVELREEATTR